MILPVVVSSTMLVNTLFCAFAVTRRANTPEWQVLVLIRQ